MSPSTRPSHSEIYKRLKKGFKRVSGVYNVHLDDTLLAEMGVDYVQVNLEEETERGGPYFLPMSQARISSLNKRPEFCIEFDDEWSTSVWDYTDTQQIHTQYECQLYHSNDESAWNALDDSGWEFRMYVLAIGLFYVSKLTYFAHRAREGSYEMQLYESQTWRGDSKAQFSFDYVVLRPVLKAVNLMKS